MVLFHLSAKKYSFWLCEVMNTLSTKSTPIDIQILTCPCLEVYKGACSLMRGGTWKARLREQCWRWVIICTESVYSWRHLGMQEDMFLKQRNPAPRRHVPAAVSGTPTCNWMTRHLSVRIANYASTVTLRALETTFFAAYGNAVDIGWDGISNWKLF